MSGHVYYRFKSQKEFQRIIFEGIGISVWDLKREIIQESKMGKGTDFDFAIYNADTDEEYANDHAIIPRSSSVIARRLPPKRPGHGNAQQYVGVNLTGSNSRNNQPLTAHVDWRGGGAISKDFRNRNETPSNTPPAGTFTPVLTGGERDSEAESMAAMFAAQDQQWQKTQETMATATRVGRNAGFRDRGGGQHRVNKGRENGLNGPSGTGSSTNPNSTGSSNNNNNGQAQFHSQAPPPQGYICYRCGQKGHWIQACPTNDNPDFEGRPRIKRTTGIPKSFLQKVESGQPVDGQNVMVTSDGSFVIAKPDNATWKQHKSVVVKNISAADIENQRPSDPDLVCSICSKLLKKSVKMICCSSSFCESCISNYLKSHSSVCPECETKVSFTPSSSTPSTNPNNNKAFVIDDERRKRSDDYIQEILKISQAAQLEQAKSNEDQAAAETSSKSGTGAQETQPASNEEDNPKSQPTKLEDTPASDLATADTPQASQPKDGPKAIPADKSAPSNSNHSNGKDAKPQVTISTEVAQLSSAESRYPRSAGPASAGSSHIPHVMNGMIDFGNNEFEGYGPSHGMPLNGAGSNMSMIHGMGMNGMGMGMGYGGNGMIMGKMMEPMMMNGMGGSGHNVVMNSNHLGFGGAMHVGNGMTMELGNGGGAEGMLGVQLNQVMMMLQNPQLNEPIRMQLLMQQQNLQQQIAMVQRLGNGTGASNHMMDHNMMNTMNMGTGNGLLMNHSTSHFGNSLGVHHQQQHSDFNQNNSFDPFGMGNFGGHHQLGFPSNALHGHHLNAGGGVGMKQVNQMSPQFNQHQHQKHHHSNVPSNFQRLPGNNPTHQNHYNRRPHHNNPQPSHPHNHSHPHMSTQINSHRDTTKRKRPEDLIELESGEKVPRYM